MRRRKDQKKTQSEIAAAAGLSRPSLANIEAGRQTLTLHQLYRLASVLGVGDVRLLLPPSLETEAADGKETDMINDDIEIQPTDGISGALKERLRSVVGDTLRKSK